MDIIKQQNDAVKAEISITPNPTTGLFTLSMSENASSEVFIYNNLGQVIYRQHINSITQQIDLSSQPKGIYFMKIQSGDKVYTEKVAAQ